MKESEMVSGTRESEISFLSAGPFYDYDPCFHLSLCDVIVDLVTSFLPSTWVASRQNIAVNDGSSSGPLNTKNITKI